MDCAVEALLEHGTLIVFGWVFAVQVGVPIPTVPLLFVVGGSSRIRVGQFRVYDGASALLGTYAAIKDIERRRSHARVPSA